MPAPTSDTEASIAPAGRRMRSDARQNVDALLEAAKAVFADAGVDAPVRSIAERAGVGVGTLYRHFPLRSDLISAVFRREMDACVAAADEIEATSPPGEALDRWIMRYTQFVATKRGLAAALHSGDPAYEPLAEYFSTRLAPTLDRLLTAATASGNVVHEVDPAEFLGAVADLCHAGGPPGTERSGRAERMVRLLLAGLRAEPGD
ncbi:TetR/AcrR family transcriptional regulator [Curtobacterium sp. MCBD17_003]|uniref:TetR/AcrR family transcriptional regulator n=1 Tax=Curtobacterium sp. MCBD17_003 TaxID=2175667 RepID=UPI0021AC31AD|nr:TetR/AcrR family transcriptional regulator [Curtobacterium sp. MCBD17_003]WIE55694.1 TetR/AcrR family transcriptional regulator [Curtobacterium sp. MCBD17_003]